MECHMCVDTYKLLKFPPKGINLFGMINKKRTKSSPRLTRFMDNNG